MTTAEDLARVRVEAEARAQRNGLRLDEHDCDAGVVWPGKRYVVVRLLDGARGLVAAMNRSYSPAVEGDRDRALSFCLRSVYDGGARAG